MKEESSFGKVKEELTAVMHSELSVSKEEEILLKAGCVWNVYNYEHSKEDFILSNEEVRKQAHSYGISYEECIRYKEYWRKILSGKRK